MSKRSATDAQLVDRDQCKSQTRDFRVGLFLPEDMILKISGIFTDELCYTYRDFLNWHSVCRVLWKKFTSDSYGPYLEGFLEKCSTRNQELAKKTLHSVFYKNIRMLAYVKVLAKVVKIVKAAIPTAEETLADLNFSARRVLWGVDQWDWGIFGLGAANRIGTIPFQKFQRQWN